MTRLFTKAGKRKLICSLPGELAPFSVKKKPTSSSSRPLHVIITAEIRFYNIFCKPKKSKNKNSYCTLKHGTASIYGNDVSKFYSTICSHLKHGSFSLSFEYSKESLCGLTFLYFLSEKGRKYCSCFHHLPLPPPPLQCVCVSLLYSLVETDIIGMMGLWKW